MSTDRNLKRCRAVPGVGLLAAVVLPAVVGCHGGSHSSGRFEAHVPIAYTPPPSHPEIFDPSAGPYRVAVARVDVDWQVRCRGDNDRQQRTVVRYKYTDGQGNVAESTLEAETDWSRNLRGNTRLWDDTLRSEVRKTLADAARAQGVELIFVDRDHLKERLDERDLRTIGLTPGDPQSWKGQELGVDAFIFARLNIDTVYESSYKQLIPGEFLGGVIPGLPGWILNRLFKPHRRVRRTMTLEGELELVDAKTGRIWVTHDISQQWVEKKKSLFRNKDVMDLEPEEQKIRDALRAETIEFVGTFFPLARHVDLYVKSGRNDAAAMGTRALMVKDYAQALEFFQQALTERPNDHRTLFAAGVACEALGRLDEALRYYSRAVYACDKHKIDEDDDEYQYAVAVRRVKRRLRYAAAVEPPAQQVSDEQPAASQPAVRVDARRRSQP